MALNADVAIKVAKAVTALAAASVAATAAYASIQKTLTGIKVSREKARLEYMQITRAQVQQVLKMCDDIAQFVGFKNVKDLHRRTGNPEVSLKLLLAHYRRMRSLVDFRKKGKAILPTDDETNG